MKYYTYFGDAELISYLINLTKVRRLCVREYSNYMMKTFSSNALYVY